MFTRKVISAMLTGLFLVVAVQIFTETAQATHTCDGLGLTGSALTSCRANPANIHPGSGQNPTGSGQNPGVNSIVNPLQSTTITEFLENIIDILLIFALPIIVFFILFAGFKFVTARGNETQITEAKAALTWAVIGGVIILGAKLIITVIQGTVSAL